MRSNYLLTRISSKTLRLLYASGGSSDLVSAHKHWENKTDSGLQMSFTFSGQVAQFCSDNGFHCIMLSNNMHRERYVSGLFTIEHLPKLSSRGWRYHYGEILYALRLLGKARRFGANVAIVDSGVTHFFLLAIFRLFRIEVVPILHNALWPNGFPPRGVVARALLKLNGIFWHHLPHASLVVSPAIKRQIEEISPRHRGQIIEFRAQFDKAVFSAIPAPPSFEFNPFKVMFVGRADLSKGIVDLAEIAALVETKMPGRVRWVVCGDGPDLDALRQRTAALDIAPLVNILGHVAPVELMALYRDVHAIIVPTRSTFAEGLAMTAIEPVLAGRPVITSKVVPALELVHTACVEAKTDDCASYADAVVRLATDEELYCKLRTSIPSQLADFTDPRFGLSSALSRAFSQIQSY